MSKDLVFRNRVSFMADDGTEVLRLDADGKVFVRGVLERTDKGLVDSFAGWVRQWCKTTGEELSPSERATRRVAYRLAQICSNECGPNDDVDLAFLWDDEELERLGQHDPGRALLAVELAARLLPDDPYIKRALETQQKLPR